MGHYFTNENLPSDIRETTSIVLGQKFTFLTDNGVFSKDGLDFGSRLLLEVIPQDEVGGKILDMGCGYGVLGIVLAKVLLVKDCDGSIIPYINPITYSNVEKHIDECKANDKVEITFIASESTEEFDISEDELESLELIDSAFLDLAENRAKRHIPMTMEDWSMRIDKFLLADDLDILKDAGKISHEIACDKALTEFEKYRLKQDKLYKSDFDLLLEEIKDNGSDNND